MGLSCCQLQCFRDTLDEASTSVKVLRARVDEMEKGRDGEVKDKRDYGDSQLLPERK